MRLATERPAGVPTAAGQPQGVTLASAAVVPRWHAGLGEVGGTFLLVLFGTGSVAAAVLTGAQVGVWQVAVAQ